MTIPDETDVAATPAIAASYFDGRHSKRHAVSLAVHDGRVIVVGDGVAREAPIDAIEISDALGTAPRLVHFRDGAFCEVADRDGLDRLVRSASLDHALVGRWEASRSWIGAAALLILGVMVGGYWYGLPVIATFAANRLPPRVEQALGRQVLETLDGPILRPTRLPMATQGRLTAGFDHLRWPAGSHQHDRIVFRSSAALGANAVALPSGDIILTDALVTLARDDEEILGVLAHEAGHVAARHGVRQLLQSSLVALFVTWFLGDISTLAATAPTALLQAKYSRDFEREADDYAAEALRQNGIAPGRLADMLERLELSRPGGRAAPAAIDYLSTHPATAERLKRLRTSSAASAGGRPRP